MKAVVAAFNQEKALVGAFSVLTNLRMELFQALMRIHNEWGIIEDLEFDCPTNCPRHRIDDTPGRGPAYLRRASRHRDHQLGSHKPNLTFYTQYFHLWEDFINTWEVTFRSHPKHRQQYCGRTMTGTMLKMPKFKILATGENENHLNVPISGCKLWSQ